MSQAPEARAETTLAADAPPLSGAGLHSGKICELVLRPAAAGAGIVFRRVDLPGSPEIPARAEHVVSTNRHVALRKGKASASTVEHLLAACVLAGLDNVCAEISSEELPAADGSSAAFLAAILGAGLRDLEVARERLRLKETVEVSGDNGAGTLRAEPADFPSLSFRFTRPAGLAGRGARFRPGKDDPDLLVRARTFCLESEIAALKSRGLGQGGSLDNCLVLRDDGSQLNPRKPAIPGEPEFHKLLDMVGDLALAGAPVMARIEGQDTGHAQNVELVLRLLENASKEVVEHNA